MRFLLLILIVISTKALYAQSDSVRISAERPDGIYLTYFDFRINNYISKEQIVSDLKKDNLDFIGKTVESGKITYTTAAGTATADATQAWAYFQNKTFYINYKGEFFRVPVFGAVCYLVATVTVINSGFYDPMFGYGVAGTRAKEIREFIINFYDGIITEFTIDRAEELISRDPQLFHEYKQLNRRNRKEQLNRYIRRYNEAHPVYFIK